MVVKKRGHNDKMSSDEAKAKKVVGGGGRKSMYSRNSSTSEREGDYNLFPTNIFLIKLSHYLKVGSFCLLKQVLGHRL